jgi:hypothetical protein
MLTGLVRYQRYMVNAVRLFAGVILCLFSTRRELLLENLVLRQQLMVPKPTSQAKTCSLRRDLLGSDPAILDRMEASGARSPSP